MATKQITITESGQIDREDFTESQIRAVRDLFNSAIWQEARGTWCGIADDIADRIAKEPDFDRDAMMDAVTEACDGAIVYTRDAEEYLMASRNSDAADDVDNGITDAAQRAFYALQQDVIEELDRRGIDPNDDSEWPGRGTDDDADESATT